jgi:hypothetical protein
MAFAEAGNYIDTSTAFISSPYIIIRCYGDTATTTAVFGRRWYDIFRGRCPIQLPNVVAHAPAPIARVPTGVSMAQAARQKRRLRLTRHA